MMRNFFIVYGKFYPAKYQDVTHLYAIQILKKNLIILLLQYQ